MGATRFATWSVRWAPEFTAVAATYFFALTLGETFIWHANLPILVAHGVIGVGFGIGAVAFFRERRVTSARPSSVGA